WVVDFDGVEDAAAFVDFEEPVDYGLDSDVAVESSRIWGDLSHGLGRDGVHVGYVALHRGPVDVDAGDSGEVPVWVELVDEVRLALVQKDAAFVDGEEGTRGLDFFEDGVSGVCGVDDGEVVLFCVAD